MYEEEETSKKKALYTDVSTPLSSFIDTVKVDLEFWHLYTACEHIVDLIREFVQVKLCK